MAQKIVGIIGGTIHGNRGAQAMLESVIGTLRENQPAMRFRVFSYYPLVDASLNTDTAIDVIPARPSDLVLRYFPGAVLAWMLSTLGIQCPRALIPKCIDNLRGCDALIDIAGISFSDGREKFLPFNILTIWPAMLLNVPVYKCSQALGPFNNPINRLTSKLFLNHCTLIFGRGPATMENLEGLNGLTTRHAQASDLAFLHKPTYTLSHENEARVSHVLSKLEKLREAGQTTVCICPSNVVAKASQGEGLDYAKAIAELIKLLGAHGVNIVLLPTASRENSDAQHNNDLPLIRQIALLAEKPRSEGWLICVDWDINFNSLKQLLGKSDAVITFRFHGLVAALSQGLPCIAVGWGHKYQELMMQFDIHDLDLDYRQFSPSNLSDLLIRLLEDRTEVRQCILSKLSAIVGLSRRQIQEIEIELSNHD